MTDLARLELQIDSKGADRARNSLGQFIKVGRTAEDTTRKLGKTGAAASKNVDKLGRSMRRLSAANATANKGMASTVKLLGALGGAFTVFRALRSTTKTLVEFGDVMATVRGIAIKTTSTLAKQGAQFSQLSAQTRALGASSKFSAKEVGEGQLFLARAGFDLSSILEALPSTLDLAAAGVVGLGEAADIASNVLAQFRLEASEMVRVSDVLVTTTIKSNTSLTQLAEAMKIVGPVAASVNQSLELTAATIGVLGNAGIQGSSAGTQLRGVMAALLSPTDQAQKVINRLAGSIGVAADQFDVAKESADGVTAPLTRVLDLFSRAGATATDFFKIFGRRQAVGAIILTTFKDELAALNDAAERANGSARELAEAMENTLGGAFRRLAAATEGLKLSIGEAGLGESMRKTVEIFAQAINIIAGVEVAQKDLIDGADTLAAAMIGVAAAFGVIFVGAIAAAGAAVLAFVGGPIAVVAGVVGGLSAAFVFLKDKTFEFGGVTGTVGDFIAAVWTAVVNVIVARFKAFAAVFSVLFKVIKNFTTNAVKQFRDTFIAPLTRLMEGLGIIWPIVLDSMLDSLKSWVKSAIAGFLIFFKFIELRFQRLKPIIDGVLDLKTGNVIGGLQKLKDGLSDAFDFSKIGKDLASATISVVLDDTVNKAIRSVKGAGKLLKIAIDQTFGPDFIDNLKLGVGVGFFDDLFAEFDANVVKSKLEAAAAAAESAVAGAADADAADVAARIRALAEEATALFDKLAAEEDAKVIDLEHLDRALGMMMDLDEALETVLMPDNERTKFLALKAFTAELELAGLTLEQVAKQTEEFDKKLDKLFELERVREFAREISNSIGDAFKDALLDINNLSDAINALGQELASIGLEQFVVGPLREGLQKGFTKLLAPDEEQEAGADGASAEATAALLTGATALQTGASATTGAASSSGGAATALGVAATALSAAATALSAAALSLGGGGGGGGSEGDDSGGGGFLSSFLKALFGGTGEDAAPETESARGNIFGFAKGGAFGGGRGLAGTLGRMLTSGPETFPMGVAGEAGPEAILPAARFGGGFSVQGLVDGQSVPLPLRRDSAGVLSVDASQMGMKRFANGGVFGGSAGAPLALRGGTQGFTPKSEVSGASTGSTLIVQNTFKFDNTNPDAFRRSQRQVEDNLAQSIQKAGRRRN